MLYENVTLIESSSQRHRISDIKSGDPLAIIDLMLDIMFVADILINFRTTYISDGEIITDPRKIALNYARGWFIIDAVAAIPFDLLFSGLGTSEVSIYRRPCGSCSTLSVIHTN